MDLTTGKITDHLRHIAIPASIGFFFNTMYNVVDTLFAGFISTEAIAALSISFPVFFIMIAFVTGLSTGASTLISNSLGQGNFREIRKITAQIFAFAVVTYIFVAPICLLVSPYLFQLLGAHGQYLDMAVSFMNIIFIGSFFFILLYSANSILLSHGNSRVMRNYLIGGFFLNTALDPWFLFGGMGLPAMGLAGIASATVTVMLVGCVYIFYAIIKDGHMDGITIRDYIPQISYFKAIAKQSLPASFNMMTIGCGIFVITYFVKNFGETAVAAYGICVRIEQIALLPTIGLTMAALSIVGQNNGAGKIERVRETIRQATRYGLLVIGVGAACMFFFPQQLISLFTHDPSVIEIGKGYLRIAAFISGAYVLLAVNVSALQGMKKPMYPMIIGVVRQIVLPLVIFYTMTHIMQFGITSIWYSIFVINWSAAVLTFFDCRYVVQNIK
jgi:putative MATE family efflux protein